MLDNIFLPHYLYTSFTFQTNSFTSDSLTSFLDLHVSLRYLTQYESFSNHVTRDYFFPQDPN